MKRFMKIRTLMVMLFLLLGTIPASAAFPQKSQQSANSARYKSQGQARSAAERVAPGSSEATITRPEGPKYTGIPPFQG